MIRTQSAGGLYLESTRAEQLGVLTGEDRPIRDIMSRQLVTIHPTASVRLAAEAMQRARVTAVVVHGSEGVLGLVTERDVMAQAASGADPAADVRQLLRHRATIVCREDDIVADAVAEMKRRHLSALPVLDGNGAVVGLLSLVEAAASMAPEAAPAWLHETKTSRR